MERDVAHLHGAILLHRRENRGQVIEARNVGRHTVGASRASAGRPFHRDDFQVLAVNDFADGVVLQVLQNRHPGQRRNRDGQRAHDALRHQDAVRHDGQAGGHPDAAQNLVEVRQNLFRRFGLEVRRAARAVCHRADVQNAAVIQQAAEAVFLAAHIVQPVDFQLVIGIERFKQLGFQRHAGQRGLFDLGQGPPGLHRFGEDRGGDLLLLDVDLLVLGRHVGVELDVVLVALRGGKFEAGKAGELVVRPDVRAALDVAAVCHCRDRHCHALVQRLQLPNEIGAGIAQHLADDVAGLVADESAGEFRLVGGCRVEIRRQAFVRQRVGAAALVA